MAALGATAWNKKDSGDFLRRRSAGRFDGYILYVEPDPKAGWYHDEDAEGKTLKDRLDELDSGLDRDTVLGSPGSELRFVLPLYYLQFGNSQLTGKTTVRRVPGFDLGPVLGHIEDPECADAHIGVSSASDWRLFGPPPSVY